MSRKGGETWGTRFLNFGKILTSEREVGVPAIGDDEPGA